MSKPAHDPDLLELVLHGTFSVRHGATSIDTLSRRGQAMLAYLANQSGMRAERAFLADLLWSDRSEEQARASLRQELSVLRRTLPEGVLDANRQHVWLMPARVGIVSGKGTFLQGFDLASEGFEDWLRVMRSGDDGLGALTDPATHPRSRPSQPRVRPTLAVLPFEELGAAETDMFADGVVEEITGALSRAHDIHVIARQSAFALRGERLDVPETAKRLGAD
jgi:hypothetical protein